MSSSNALYIPAYAINHDFSMPGIVRNKAKVVEGANLPDIGQKVDWSPLAEIFYSPRLATLESVFDFCVKNIRPILVVIEGPSGEAKTSLAISLLGWSLWRYSHTKLTVKNFKKYFLLGKYVALRPDVVSKLYRKRQFFAVDEAHLALNSMRATSRMNQDANDLADTIRQNQIFWFLITIFSGLLDKRLINYKVMMRIIVKYNSQKYKRIIFDVQLNIKYIDEKGTQHWDYFPLEKNRMAKWCPEDLWDISKTLKDDNVFKKFGGSYDAMMKDTTKMVEIDDDTALKEAVFTNNNSLKEWVRAFFLAGWNESNTKSAIRTEQIKRGEKKLMSAGKYKEILQIVKEEIALERKKQNYE